MWCHMGAFLCQHSNAPRARLMTRLAGRSTADGQWVYSRVTAQLGCTHTNSSMYVEWPSGPSTGRAEQLRGHEYTTMVPLHTATNDITHKGQDRRQLTVYRCVSQSACWWGQVRWLHLRCADHHTVPPAVALTTCSSSGGVEGQPGTWR